jgi:hypothetical protein
LAIGGLVGVDTSTRLAVILGRARNFNLAATARNGWYPFLVALNAACLVCTMDRASLAGRIWYESSVPVFLERFVLPVLATALIGVIVLNPFRFDWQQQLSLAIAVVAFAYFVGHSVHKLNNPPKPITSFEVPSAKHVCAQRK